MTALFAIRPSHADDSGQLAEILREATEDLRRIYRPAATVPASHGTVANDASQWTVVDATDRIVASFETLVEPGPALLIRTVAVARAARRQGVLRTIVGFACRQASTQGLVGIRLVTIAETGNPSIFERCGFEAEASAVSSRYCADDGSPVHEVSMLRMPS